MGEWSLRGRTALITGATSGLGRVAAFALARMGAQLYLLCRDRGRADILRAEIERATGNGAVQVLIADLSVQREVQRAGEEFLATGQPLHVLLNNAGAVFLRRELTADGLERTFALNHLAYFTLTGVVLDRLRASAPARIVNVASDAYAMAKGRFDFANAQAEQRYRFMRQYAYSKLANLLFTRELARRLDASAVTVNAVTPPGLTATQFAHNTHPLAKAFFWVAKPFCVSAEDGARGLIHVCSAPELAGVSGRFFVGTTDTPLKPAATNDDDARRLWELSERLQAKAGVASEAVVDLTGAAG